MKEEIKDLLAKYKIPCSCPKGGLIGENKLVCEKCDGSEWVLPDDILKALAKQKEEILKIVEADLDEWLTILKQRPTEDSIIPYFQVQRALNRCRKNLSIKPSKI